MTGFEINRCFVENLEKERYRLGLSQEKMSEKLEISLSSYKRIINFATEKINLWTIYRMYFVTGKTIYELMGVTDQYTVINNKLKDLSPGQVVFVNSVVDFERLFSSSVEKQEEYLSVFVPTGNMEDGMIYDSANVEKKKIFISGRMRGEGVICGIRITSNHLHPVYNLGDILLISKRPIRDGDTGIFINRKTGCAYVRKFHQTSPCELEPINEYGESIFVDSNNKEEMDNWIKFGVVISKIR